MAVSAVGKKKFTAFGGVIILDIIVLALSLSVNVFQGFFFVADLFPFLLSIITLAILLLSIVLELTASNPFTAHLAFEIPLLTILTCIWLCFNAFSTSRWSNMPISCSSIPDEFGDMRGWCKNVQALKALIWMVWVALLLLTSSLLYFAITQAHRGHAQVWRIPLSRYDKSNANSNQFTTDISSYYRGSSLFDFRLRTSFGANRKGKSSLSSRDFFASSPVIRTSFASSAFGAGKAGVGAGAGSFSSGAVVQSPQSAGYQNRYATDEVEGF
jgi:hypothetical protein